MKIRTIRTTSNPLSLPVCLELLKLDERISISLQSIATTRDLSVLRSLVYVLFKKNLLVETSEDTADRNATVHDYCKG